MLLQDFQGSFSDSRLDSNTSGKLLFFFNLQWISPATKWVLIIKRIKVEVIIFLFIFWTAELSLFILAERLCFHIFQYFHISNHKLAVGTEKQLFFFPLFWGGRVWQGAGVLVCVCVSSCYHIFGAIQSLSKLVPGAGDVWAGGLGQTTSTDPFQLHPSRDSATSVWISSWGITYMTKTMELLYKKEPMQRRYLSKMMLLLSGQWQSESASCDHQYDNRTN